MTEKSATNFAALVEYLCKNHGNRGVTPEQIWGAIRTAVDPVALVDNLAETLRVSTHEMETRLAAAGFANEASASRDRNAGETMQAEGDRPLAPKADRLNLFLDLFRVTASPDLAEGRASTNALDELAERTADNAATDPFIEQYRTNIEAYHNDFLAGSAEQMKDFIASHFARGPEYLVTCGIGANEQFAHFVSALNNASEARKLTWVVVNSPGQLRHLPADATRENTLFMEFSRSGVTQETVKTHEYTDSKLARVVFANKGPLRKLAERDGNLCLDIPDEVSGRFGRNKTPILLAPMVAAGMDTESYWRDASAAIDAFDVTDPASLPVVLAKFIHAFKERTGRNFIYFGCNDDHVRCLAQEFEQYWNEGVNKNENDILTSTFLGLPRDSHMNLEGVLGNAPTKLGLFLIRRDMETAGDHPLVSADINAINADHSGLCLGDEEVVLAMANYERFAQVMPSVLIDVFGTPSLRHSAVLGQLFADTTYVYSRMNRIDPGSNPEVKAVRERGDGLLKEAAARRRNGQDIF